MIDGETFVKINKAAGWYSSLVLLNGHPIPLWPGALALFPQLNFYFIPLEVKIKGSALVQ
jgi:hypothetical protein